MTKKQGQKDKKNNKNYCLFPMDSLQIALQVALVYAKIARSDYPRDWPSLFHDLLANLNTAGQSSSSSTLTIRRVYLILHHIIKELSSKRLFADQKNFSEVGRRVGGWGPEGWKLSSRSCLPSACLQIG